MKTTERKLVRWLINEHQIGCCVREDASKCLQCQEFYQILDEIKKEHAIEFLSHSIHADKYPTDLDIEKLYNNWINSNKP